MVGVGEEKENIKRAWRKGGGKVKTKLNQYCRLLFDLKGKQSEDLTEIHRGALS